MDLVYFVLIYNWLTERIDTFGMDLMGRFMAWASGMAMVLVTLWIMLEGYRVLTGQARASLLATAVNLTRIAIVVTAATTMSVAGTDLHRLLTTDLGREVNRLFSGSTDTTAQAIDRNLAWTQVALATIDAVQVPAGDAANNDAKNHAMLLAGLGSAGPPLTAAALLLFYQFALALCIGLGPLFILCLIFQRTRDLFRRWLLYGLGTLFSMAVLAFVSSIVLELTLRVSAALWASSVTGAITGLGAEGYSSQALQQGGLGLLLTVLIVSVPPMAAYFFQGTVGSFSPYAAVNGGGPVGSHPGPQGQPPQAGYPNPRYPGAAWAGGMTAAPHAGADPALSTAWLATRVTGHPPGSGDEIRRTPP